jgi:hypothetical protein
MISMKTLTALFLSTAVLAQAPPPPVEKPLDIDSAMMQTTFRIVGPNAAQPGKQSTGTGFLVGRPTPQDPKQSFRIAVTAAHVLKAISGDEAVFVIRVKDGVTKYKRVAVRVQIRSNGAPLWKEHPTADVAVMYCPLPNNNAMEVIPLDSLATDNTFVEYGIHPGEDVNSLGYPFGYEVNEFGFPLLRKAQVASFPLVPAKTMKKFVADFFSFGGNSGGPVYIYSQNRTFNGLVHLGSSVFALLGLVSENISSPDNAQNIGLAYVVYAEYIKEAINLMPANPGAPASLPRRP